MHGSVEGTAGLKRGIQLAAAFQHKQGVDACQKLLPSSQRHTGTIPCTLGILLDVQGQDDLEGSLIEPRQALPAFSLTVRPKRYAFFFRGS